MEDGGRGDDRDADHVHASFFDKIKQFIGAQVHRSILRLEALVLQQVDEHRAGEFVAFGAGRETVNAADGRGGRIG